MWRYRWVVVAIVATAVGLAVLYGVTRPAEHRAFATIVVQDPTTQSVFGVAQTERPERYVANQATILESNLVVARATELIVARGATGIRADPDAISVAMSGTPTATTSRWSWALRPPIWQSHGPTRIVDAYTEIRQEAAAATFSAALDQLEESAATMDLSLSALQREIDTAVQQNPATAELARQYNAALVRLTELQAQLPDASGSTLSEVQEQLDDLLQQLQTMQLVASLESQQPELRSSSRSSDCSWCGATM
jgi:uncharacterized protein involved in exopolysaccharide biosynthesis